MSFSFNIGRSQDNFRDNEKSSLDGEGESKKSSPKTGLAIGAITAIVGLLVVIFGISSGNEDKRLIDSGIRTEAVVSKVDFTLNNNSSSSNTNTSSSNKSEISKTTTVSFTAKDGKAYTTKYITKQRNTGMSQQLSATEDVGKKEIVFYDASNPSKAVVEGHETNSFITSIIGAVALVFGAIILITSGSSLKKSREEEEQA